MPVSVQAHHSLVMNLKLIHSVDKSKIYDSGVVKLGAE